MKRTLPVLLCLCLLLSGCAGGGDETLPSTGQTTAPTTQATETTAETTVETTVETTAPSIVYRHPLTGAPLEEAFTGRITSVVIDNIREAMPQYGISNADILYEIETEGGITRCLAIFTDFTETESLGPVRSARSYFNNVSVAYDATIIHCGGSVPGINGHYSDNGQKISNWAHINEQNNGSYFFRDQERIRNGYNSWDCLFTSGKKMIAALAAKGYDTPYESGIDLGLSFADELDLKGETAQKVTVKFLGSKTTTMTYAPDTGLYEAEQYGKSHVDAGTGETMAYRNVLVLQTKQWKINDGTYYRSFYTLIGSGSGYFACGGKIVPIKWSRETLNDPFSYTLEDGTPLTLGAGKTYVGVVSANVPLAYN